MNRWRETLVLGLVVTLHNLQRMAPVPLLTEFCQRLGTDYVGAGNLFSMQLLGTALFNIPVGILADRCDNRILMAAGAGLGAVFSMLFALTHDYHAAVFARFGLGLSSAMLFLPTMRYIVAGFPNEIKGRTVGFMEMGAALGMIAALIGLPLLARGLSLTQTYLVIPVFSIALLGLIFPGLKKVASDTRLMVRGQFRALFSHQSFWHLGAFVFLNMLVAYAVIGWVPTYLRLALGYSAAKAGVVSSFINLTLAAASPLAGMVSDRIGARIPVMLFGSVLSTLGFIAFIQTGYAWLIVAAALMQGVSMALTIPLATVHVGETFRAVGSGLAISASNTIGRLAASLPGLIGGAILETTGALVLFWGFSLVCSAARIPFLLAAGKHRPDQAPEGEADR